VTRKNTGRSKATALKQGMLTQPRNKFNAWM
jgi:hypothetical protein